jgi:hypothetical protein
MTTIRSEKINVPGEKKYSRYIGQDRFNTIGKWIYKHESIGRRHYGLAL